LQTFDILPLLACLSANESCCRGSKKTRWTGILADEAMILELQVLSQLLVCGTAVSKAEDKAWILLICDDQM
jgi:hypothetical protein